MPNNQRLTLRVRLEDAVALAFFFVYWGLAFYYREVWNRILEPVDVLIVIPAVCLLLGKELIHYFWASRSRDAEASEDLGEFIRPYWIIIRDWLPFFMLLFMYYTMWGNATHLMITQDRDAQLIAWDQKLLGYQPSLVMQGIISPPLTAWMEFAYVFHLLNIPIVACFIYIKRSREQFREMMSGLLTLSAFGLMGYLLVPAIGPMYTLRDQYTVPLTQQFGIFQAQMDFIDYARVHRDCFPSLHVGISFILWLYAWRNSRRLFWILAPFILSLWFSTLYLRYHYMVDVIAGLILAPLCFWLSNWLFKRFGIIQIPLPAKWEKWLRRFQSRPDVFPGEIEKGIEERP